MKRGLMTPGELQHATDAIVAQHVANGGNLPLTPTRPFGHSQLPI
jgi:hypothetical protein